MKRLMGRGSGQVTFTPEHYKAQPVALTKDNFDLSHSELVQFAESASAILRTLTMKAERIK